MNPILDACLRSWPWEPWLIIGLFLSAAIYIRGWRFLRRRDPSRWGFRELTAFLGGLVAIFLALASPIEPFSFFFLQVHMLQHLLLMMVAPPLIWLGAPMFPMLRGLPTPVRVVWVAPLMRAAIVRRVFGWLTLPLPAWFVYIAMTWLWHMPRFYDLALRSSNWHYLQHVCFLGSALLFWYPVVRPYPSRPKWSLWWLVPFLILADVQNTVLSALLTFSSRVVYSYYDEIPRLGNISAHDDQAAAGVLMWVPGSVAFLVPLFWVGLRLLFDASPTKTRGQPPAARRISLTVVNDAPSPADVLRLPILGRFLRWRHARVCLQIPLLILAALVALDGFRGPDVGAMNLAGVLPWVHWRGVLIFGLLAFGNVFCMACPFMLPRSLARRLRPATRNWPRWLRNKWLAVALLILFLWSYEAFALWDSPWLTAWIIVAYFAAALVVDSMFRGAAFCKYVCPIGQFNFVQSLVSPLEIKVRDPDVCDACTTKDCIRGRDTIPGCELRLYQPRKSSNMDCTFCLDCIHACPHDNIGLLPTMPGQELLRDPQRSGIGRFSGRLDLAALVVVLVFGAFVNAALMTGPVVEFQDRIARATGWSPLGTTSVVCLLALVVVPYLLVSSAGVLSRILGQLTQKMTAVVARWCYCLVPLGFAMWLTHYSFHFLTSYATIVPTTQRFAADLGVSLGSPAWSYACCLPAAAWLLRLEILILDLGLLGSLYVAFRIAKSHATGPWRAFAALAPWAGLIVALFVVGVWIVFQPMEMRGAMPMPG